MSDFFTKLKEELNKGAHTISVKSAAMFESNKIRNNIAHLNKSKNEILLELGTKVYYMKNEGAMNLDECADLFERLKAIDKVIVEKEDELKEVLKKDEEQDNNKRCECGAFLDDDANFCGKCGEKVMKDEQQTSANVEDEIIIDLFDSDNNHDEK